MGDCSGQNVLKLERPLWRLLSAGRSERLAKAAGGAGLKAQILAAFPMVATRKRARVPGHLDDSPLASISTSRVPLELVGGHAQPARMVEYFRQGKLTDVTILVDGRSYAAHRNVLAAASDYLDRLFRPLRELSGKVTILQRAATSLARLPNLVELQVKGSPDLRFPPPDIVTGGREAIINFLMSNMRYEDMQNLVVKEEIEAQFAAARAKDDAEAAELAQSLTAPLQRFAHEAHLLALRSRCS